MQLPLSLNVTARQIRAYCCSLSLKPYEDLITARTAALGFRQSVNRQLALGYVRDGYSLRQMPPIDWSAYTGSFSVRMHAWDPIGDLMSAFSVFDDRRCIETALAYSRAWIAEFQAPVLDRYSAEELDALVLPAMPNSWYDMAVGRRTYRLAFFLDYLARQDSTADEELELFWSALRFHLLLLNRDHFFRKHTNHGLYQALGHLAAAGRFLGLPGMAAEKQIAVERLTEIVDKHFSEDGAHKEHSPGYHYLLMATLSNAERCGLFAGLDLSVRMDVIQDTLTWMTKPDRHFVTFGDTNPYLLTGQPAFARLYQNPHLQHIITNGLIGSPPEIGVKAYKKGGYAFARLHSADSAGEPAKASYLAQIAAFHSRVHKHADHLSFVWYDKGVDILIDPGRFAYTERSTPGSPLFNDGFWYKDPKRIYIERTHAHNCVGIDGEDYKRKGADQFGSALLYAGEQLGTAVTDCQLVHSRTISHWRGLILSPGEFLIVLDQLNDRLGAKHDFRQWFQLAPEWTAEWDQGGLVAQHAKGIQLRVTSLAPDVGTEALAIGQEEPELLGWTSDMSGCLIPSTSFCFSRRSTEAVSFATLFSFGNAPVIDQSSTYLDAEMKVGRMRWSIDNMVTELGFERSDGSHLEVTRLTRDSSP